MDHRSDLFIKKDKSRGKVRLLVRTFFDTFDNDLDRWQVIIPFNIKSDNRSPGTLASIFSKTPSSLRSLHLWFAKGRITSDKKFNFSRECISLLDPKGATKKRTTNKGRRKKCILCTWSRAVRQLHTQRFPNSCEEHESGIDTKCAADLFERNVPQTRSGTGKDIFWDFCAHPKLSTSREKQRRKKN